MERRGSLDSDDGSEDVNKCLDFKKKYLESILPGCEYY